MNDKTRQKTRGRPRAFDRADAIEKAMHQFRQHGYQATSISDLRKVMNMNSPSIYNVFGDKEHLFLEVLDYYHTPYKEAIVKIFSETEDTLSAIKSLMALSKQLHGNEELIGCLIVNSLVNVDTTDSAITQSIKNKHKSTITLIVNRLKEGQEIGDIPKELDITPIADYIYGILQGAAAVSRGLQSSAAVKNLIDQGYQGFLRLVSKE